MTTALMLIDVQRNMLEGAGAATGADALRTALAGLLDRARAAGAPVVHVQNNGPAGAVDEPGSAGWELVFAPRPHELVVRKEVSDTFEANPGLPAQLRARGVDTLVVAGLQSEYCVQATGRGALGEGFTVLLAAGGHGTYDDERPAADIATTVERELSAEGAEVAPVEDIRFR